MDLTLGIVIAILAGAINGSFALPMKAVKKWSWENIWFPFCFLSMLVFPWLIANKNVPQLMNTYSNVPVGSIVTAILWGAAAYFGSLIHGISLTYIGTALSFALLVGSMSIVGVFLPMLIFNPETLSMSGGKLIIVGIIALAIALVVFIRAGKLKDIATGGENTSGIGDKVKKSAVTGMILAICGGVLSGFLSLGLKMPWAKSISDSAVVNGLADPSNATNAILAFVLTGGFIVNVIYSYWLLSKNKTWSRYKEKGVGANWLLIIVMGMIYSGSVILWGMSTSMLGKLGPSVGWALFIGMIAIGSNIGGFATGEWKNAGSKAIKTMLTGVGIIVVGMILIGYGNYLIG
jgi:L-rhamnose-H+ transport protein